MKERERESNYEEGDLWERRNLKHVGIKGGRLEFEHAVENTNESTGSGFHRFLGIRLCVRH